jgi:hypothetical protein
MPEMKNPMKTSCGSLVIIWFVTRLDAVDAIACAATVALLAEAMFVVLDMEGEDGQFARSKWSKMIC